MCVCHRLRFPSGTWLVVSLGSQSSSQCPATSNGTQKAWGFLGPLSKPAPIEDGCTESGIRFVEEGKLLGLAQGPIGVHKHPKSHPTRYRAPRSVNLQCGPFQTKEDEGGESHTMQLLHVCQTTILCVLSIFGLKWILVIPPLMRRFAAS